MEASKTSSTGDRACFGGGARTIFFCWGFSLEELYTPPEKTRLEKADLSASMPNENSPTAYTTRLLYRYINNNKKINKHEAILIRTVRGYGALPHAIKKALRLIF